MRFSLKQLCSARRLSPIPLLSKGWFFPSHDERLGGRRQRGASLKPGSDKIDCHGSRKEKAFDAD